MQENQDKTQHFSILCFGKCCLLFQGFPNRGVPQMGWHCTVQCWRSTVCLEHLCSNPFCFSLCHHYLAGQATGPGVCGSHFLRQKRGPSRPRRMRKPPFALLKTSWLIGAKDIDSFKSITIAFFGGKIIHTKKICHAVF